MDRINKIERLKDELFETDYIVIKASEGHDVSEHGDYIGYRQGIRDKINELMIMTDEEYYDAYPEEREIIETLPDQLDENVETLI